MTQKNLAIAAFAAAGVAIGWSAAQGVARGGLSPQDYIDIQELYATYARAYDTNEGNGQVWAGTFTPDGVFTYGDTKAAGQKELAAYSNSRPQTGPKIQHWNANVIIRPTPDGATSSLYIMLVSAGEAGKPPSIMLVTNYNDVLVKTAQGWRIKSRAGGPNIAPLRQ